MDFKMQHQLHLGKDATFHFGIRDSKEMEEWHSGIQFLDDWSYFDSEEKKLGLLKIFRNIKFFRKTQWTVHYKLNKNKMSDNELAHLKGREIGFVFQTFNPQAIATLIYYMA